MYMQRRTLIQVRWRAEEPYKDILQNQYIFTASVHAALLHENTYFRFYHKIKTEKCILIQIQFLIYKYDGFGEYYLFWSSKSRSLTKLEI